MCDKHTVTNAHKEQEDMQITPLTVASIVQNPLQPHDSTITAVHPINPQTRSSMQPHHARSVGVVEERSGRSLTAVQAGDEEHCETPGIHYKHHGLMI